MSENQTIKVPVWFWIVAALFLLWNLMGVAAYVMDVLMTEEQMAALPEAQREMYAERPVWVVAFYAIATWGALAASILLLLRKKLALIAYIISLVAVVIQFGYVLFVMDAIGKIGAWSAIFPGVIFLIGLGEVLFAKMAQSKGLLK